MTARLLTLPKRIIEIDASTDCKDSINYEYLELFHHACFWTFLLLDYFVQGIAPYGHYAYTHVR